METCILRACLIFSSYAHKFLPKHLRNSLPLLPGAYLPKPCVLGKTEGKRRRKQQSMRCLDSITDLMDRNLNKFWEIDESGLLQSTESQRVRHNLVTEQQQQPSPTNFPFTTDFVFSSFSMLERKDEVVDRPILVQ